MSKKPKLKQLFKKSFRHKVWEALLDLESRIMPKKLVPLLVPHRKR